MSPLNDNGFPFKGRFPPIARSPDQNIPPTLLQWKQTQGLSGRGPHRQDSLANTLCIILYGAMNSKKTASKKLRSITFLFNYVHESIGGVLLFLLPSLFYVFCK